MEKTVQHNMLEELCILEESGIFSQCYPVDSEDIQNKPELFSCFHYTNRVELF